MTGPEVPAPPGEVIPSPQQTPLYFTFEQARYARQAQIRTIEERTGRRLICYVGGPASEISAYTVPPFVDLLHDVEKGASLDLLLHTPGGDVDQAERIVLMCRKRVGDGEFRVVVPDSAKSAGTLIAIASDEIVMGEPSELGPIDPIVFITTANGERMSRPAQSFLDGLQEIVNRVGEKDLSPAYFPLLDKLDPALIDFCRKALARSEKFAQKFLRAYMLKDNVVQAEATARKLNDVQEFLSHGAVIDANSAQDLGLKVNNLPHDDDLWLAYWRLYCACRMALQQPTDVLYEGQKSSLIL